MTAHTLRDYHIASISQAVSSTVVAQQKHCYIFLVSSGTLRVTHPNLPDINTLIFAHIVTSDTSTTV
jgi:hypothetical protein